MTLPHDERSRRIGWLVLLGLPTFAVSFAFALKAPERGAGYAMLILSFSLILEFVILNVGEQGSFALAKLLTLAEGVKIVMLVGYWIVRSGEPFRGRFAIGLTLGVISAFCACAVVAVCFSVVAAAMAGRRAGAKTDPGAFQGIVRQLHSNRVQSLGCMLLAFLHMTYFLVFALAFHDKTSPNNTLQTNTAIDWRRKSHIPAPFVTGTARQSTCDSPSRQKVWKLFFVEGSTDVEYTKKLRRIVESRRQEQYICTQELGGRVAMLSPLAPPGVKEKDKHVRVAAWNLRELYELRSLFIILRKDTPYRLQVVQIQGHANDTRVRETTATYASNTEVSRIRGERVQQLLQDLAREVAAGGDPVPLAFLSVSGANQAGFLDDDPLHWADADQLERSLSVEFRLDPVKSADEIVMSAQARPVFTLLDYTYFMIYTVTTTGYGDMAPVSITAKFLVSIANLFELFFIVIVFNAIFALRQDGDLTEKPAGGESSSGVRLGSEDVIASRVEPTEEPSDREQTNAGD